MSDKICADCKSQIKFPDSLDENLKEFNCLNCETTLCLSCSQNYTEQIDNGICPKCKEEMFFLKDMNGQKLDNSKQIEIINFFGNTILARIYINFVFCYIRFCINSSIINTLTLEICPYFDRKIQNIIEILMEFEKVNTKINELEVPFVDTEAEYYKEKKNALKINIIIFWINRLIKNINNCFNNKNEPCFKDKNIQEKFMKETCLEFEEIKELKQMKIKDFYKYIINFLKKTHKLNLCYCKTKYPNHILNYNRNIDEVIYRFYDDDFYLEETNYPHDIYRDDAYFLISDSIYAIIKEINNFFDKRKEIEYKRKYDYVSNKKMQDFYQFTQSFYFVIN